jgi:hypothetical protein
MADARPAASLASVWMSFCEVVVVLDTAQMGPPLTPVSSHDAKVVAANLLEGNHPSRDYTGIPFALAIRHQLAAKCIKTTMSAYPTGASDIGYMV